MGGNDECPAVYVSDDPSQLIVQGKILDTTDLTALLDLASDETAVRIPTETVLRAVGLFLADRGRSDLRTEIEACAVGLEAAGVLR